MKLKIFILNKVIFVIFVTLKVIYLYKYSCFIIFSLFILLHLKMEHNLNINVLVIISFNNEIIIILLPYLLFYHNLEVEYLLYC